MKAILATLCTLVLGFFGYQTQSQSAGEQALQKLEATAQASCEIIARDCLPSGECEITCENSNGETRSFVVDCDSVEDCESSIDCESIQDCETSGDCGAAIECAAPADCDSGQDCEVEASGDCSSFGADL